MDTGVPMPVWIPVFNSWRLLQRGFLDKFSHDSESRDHSFVNYGIPWGWSQMYVGAQGKVIGMQEGGERDDSGEDQHLALSD